MAVSPADRPAGPIARLRLRTRLLLLFGLAAVALTMVVGLLLYSLNDLYHRRNAVIDRLDPASLAVGDLRAAILDQETGVRGYVLSSDVSFLEPYVTGQTSGEEAFDELDRLLQDSPVAGGELAAARAAVQDWRSGYATRAITGVRQGDTARITASFLDDSRDAFERVRGAVDDLGAAIDTQRSEALDDWTAAYRQVVVVAFATVGVLLVVGVLVAVGLRRSVTRPVEELVGDVQRVADGELQSPISGHGPPELVGLADHIEAMRRRILDELDRLNDANAAVASQARELERSNADLEQFAYVASHDLQEPLRKIAGFCQLLERRYKGQLDDKADQYIAFVVDGAKRMQELINDLLAFSRVGRTTDRFVSVPLNAAVDAGIANLGSGPEEQGATIDVGELPTVKGDPRLLTALFQNLIGNAVKFHGDEPPVVRVLARRDDDQTCEIAVSDNGIGISAEYADQIFTLFQRLHNKSQYDGTGIGLALCKKIVEFHGGTIRLDSEAPGPGATFVIRLPLHAEVPAPALVPGDATAEDHQGGRPELPSPTSPSATTANTTTTTTTTTTEVLHP